MFVCCEPFQTRKPINLHQSRAKLKHSSPRALSNGRERATCCTISLSEISCGDELWFPRRAHSHLHTHQLAAPVTRAFGWEKRSAALSLALQQLDLRIVCHNNEARKLPRPPMSQPRPLSKCTSLPQSGRAPIVMRQAHKTPWI